MATTNDLSQLNNAEITAVMGQVGSLIKSSYDSYKLVHPVPPLTPVRLQEYADNTSRIKTLQSDISTLLGYNIPFGDWKTNVDNLNKELSQKLSDLDSAKNNLSYRQSDYSASLKFGSGVCPGNYGDKISKNKDCQGQKRNELTQAQSTVDNLNLRIARINGTDGRIGEIQAQINACKEYLGTTVNAKNIEIGNLQRANNEIVNQNLGLVRQWYDAVKIWADAADAAVTKQMTDNRTAAGEIINKNQTNQATQLKLDTAKLDLAKQAQTIGLTQDSSGNFVQASSNNGTMILLVLAAIGLVIAFSK